MKKIILLLAILLIGCSKDEETIQQYDCGCTEVWARDASENRFFPTDIRICEFPNDSFRDWSSTDDRIIVEGWSYSKADQVSNEQGCN